MDIITYALLKKYVKNSLVGIGALKGAPCEVESVVRDGETTTITLKWIDTDGGEHLTSFDVNDGATKYPTRMIKETLLASDWNNGLQTLTIDDIKETDNGIIGLLNDATQEEVTAASEAIISIHSVTDDHITFECETTPTIDINIGILVLNDGTMEEGGGSGKLKEDLTASITVGGIPTGTTYTKGTKIEDILVNLLNPVLFPTLTAPSGSLAGTGNKLLKSGSTISVTLTATLNRGSINPAYGTSGYRAGEASGYSLNGGTAQTSNKWTQTVSASNNSFQAVINYNAGEQPLDSVGNDYSNPLPAGSVTTNTVKYDFVDPIWANTASILAIDELALVAKSTKQKDLVFPDQTVANPEVFDIPASWNVTAVEVKNDLSGAFEDALDQFDVTDVTHDDAAGNAVDYKRYTFALGFDTGERTVRVKWN